MTIKINSNGGGATASINKTPGQLAVTTVQATRNIVKSISGGADAEAFIIDADTGVLQFAAVPDYEAPADANTDNFYEVQVQVAAGGQTTPQTITVEVLDLPEPGTDGPPNLIPPVIGQIAGVIYSSGITDIRPECHAGTWEAGSTVVNSWEVGDTDTGPWTTISGWTGDTSGRVWEEQFVGKYIRKVETGTKAGYPGSRVVPSNAELAMPSWTPRANKRYFAPNGSNSNSGLSPASPWLNISASLIPSIPADCELIFADGTYTQWGYSAYGGQVYFNWPDNYPSTNLTYNQYPPLPTGITIRSNTWRRAVLNGSACLKYAFNISYCRDLELWGLAMPGWQCENSGLVNSQLDIDGLRVVGCSSIGWGSQYGSEWFYTSSNTKSFEGPNNIYVGYNETYCNNSAVGGEQIICFSGGSNQTGGNAAVQAGWRNVLSEHHRVRGTMQRWHSSDSDLLQSQNMTHRYWDFRTVVTVRALWWECRSYGYSENQGTQRHGSIFVLKAGTPTGVPWFWKELQQNAITVHDAYRHHNRYYREGVSGMGTLYTAGIAEGLKATEVVAAPPPEVT